MTVHHFRKEPSWRAWLRGFRHAFRGLGTLLATQWNARIHVAAAALAVLLGFLWGLARWEWCAVLLSIALVLVSEALNTALEFLVDLASPGIHPLAGKAKDVAAGAVLLSALTATAVGAVVFGPRLWRFF